METVIEIDTMKINPAGKLLLRDIYQIKKEIELTTTKKIQEEQKKRQIQMTLNDIVKNPELQKQYEKQDLTLLKTVTNEYQRLHENNWQQELEQIEKKYQEINQKIDKYGILAPLKKIIVLMQDDTIKGFLEYCINYENEEVVIDVDSLYVQNQNVTISQGLIKLLEFKINELSMYKKINVNFKQVVTNDPTLVNIEETSADMNLETLEKQDLELYTLQDIEQNPELLDNLTNEQIKALTELVASDEDIVKVDLEKSLAINSQQEILNAKKEGNNYIIEKPTTLDELDNYKLDDSLSLYKQGPVVEDDYTPTLEKKDPVYVKTKTNRKKQGYADALIFTLLTGFCAGILTTVCFLVVYFKLC